MRAVYTESDSTKSSVPFVAGCVFCHLTLFRIPSQEQGEGKAWGLSTIGMAVNAQRRAF